MAFCREEATLVGCGTHNEVWFSGAKQQTGVVEKPMETCVTATWMKFCDQLLRLTGDVRYADELEKNLYNGLLGAMMPDGQWWAYFDGLMGVRVPSYVQHADVGAELLRRQRPARADADAILGVHAKRRRPGRKSLRSRQRADRHREIGNHRRLSRERPALKSK